MSDSEDDVPLGKRPVKSEVKVEKKGRGAASKKKAKADDSDDDVPLGARNTAKGEDGGKRKREKKSHVDDSDDEDEPLSKQAKKPKKETKPKKSDKKKGKDKKGGKASKTKAKAKAKGKTEEKEKKPKKEVKVEPVYEWWKEEEPLPEGKKWRFLEHNGVIFPPKYEPHGVKMLYDGKEVDLDAEQESVATMFAAMGKTDYASKETFVKNFWREFKKILGDSHPIKDLKKCDFQPIVDWIEADRAKKKEITKEEKVEIKAAKDEMEAPYGTVILDSHTEKNGNFRVEPAGLFRGRGEHPKMGNVKGVIAPEDISMNCSEDAKPPRCPLPGHAWQSVVHKDDATWLAYYKDTINGEFKYIFLSAGSSLKGQSDREKFEKARSLKGNVKNIRKRITEGLKSKDAKEAQQNSALWLIDNLAIRAGNEKDTSEEADTVGCCSLRVEHITLGKDEEGETIYFNFLGKDSIEYKNLLKIRPTDSDRALAGEEDPSVSFVRAGEEANFQQLFKNMERFCGGKSKKKDDDVFDQLSTSVLNQYLKELMPGLTAKVFRTYNASYTLDQELGKLDDHDDKKAICRSETTQLKFYNDANYQVAILCNHSKAVSKGFDTAMGKMDEKTDEMQAELTGLKKEKKKDDATKKKIASLEERIHKHKTQQEIKQKLAGVALSTSKVNYLDPRITVAWCKKYGMPLSKVFNKSLITKFKWAIDEADENFRF